MSADRTDARREERNPFRMLPSVDEALRTGAIAALAATLAAGAGRELLAGLVQAVLDEWRAEIKAGALDADGLEARLAAGALAREVERRVREERGRGVVRVINATGVVLHTGLGRAPVHPAVAAAMKSAAESYCVLEVDRFSGERNRRDDRLSELLGRLVGSEAGIAVNNNAGAAFLTMNTFAGRREAIVSRGELVEIGGSFRVPDVMARAGVKLVEVGSTNRTRLADYERAMGPATGLLMKVHTSNFRVVGFTEEVDPAEMARLGREHGVTSAWDLGSGLIEREGMRPLLADLDETDVREAVASTIDVVTFSGDKLLGGPQAGLVVGGRDALEAMRKNPIYRALRLDKVSLAGLEKTVELLLAGRGDEIPARAMMAATVAELKPRAEELAQGLRGVPGVEAEVVPSQAQPGSGSAPTVFLDSLAVRVKRGEQSAASLGAALRAADPPVFGRIQDDVLWLDVRTLSGADVGGVIAAFQGL